MSKRLQFEALPRVSQVGEAAEGPSIPSMNGQLHQELSLFHSALLSDIRSLLRAEFTDALDRHKTLLIDQETIIKHVLKGQASVPVPNEGLGPTSPRCEQGSVFQECLVWQAAPMAMDTGSLRLNDLEMEKTKKLPPRTHKASKTGLFGHAERFIRDRTSLDVEHYDVRDRYKTTGVFQFIARSSIFMDLTLLVICLNAVYLGIDADRRSNSPQADWLDRGRVAFQVCDHFFCTFFALEILIRFAAFEYKSDSLKDHWFKCDLCLVLLMILETWVLPIFEFFTGEDSRGWRAGLLRLVRLLRLARMTRLMRALPELVTMLKGLLVACRAVVAAVLLLVLLVYVFAIVMQTLLHNNKNVRGHWATVSECMWTLVLNGVFLDGIAVMVRNLVNLNEILALCVFLLFVFITAVTVMNMVIGILCQVITQVAHVEQENTARNELRRTILQMLKRLDADGSGDISKEELVGVICDPNAVKMLEDLDVDLRYFLDLQEMVYERYDTQLSIAHIMNAILECRGDRHTTMQDLVNSYNFTRWTVNSLLDTQTAMLKSYMEQFVGKLQSPFLHAMRSDNCQSQHLAQPEIISAI